ncbi:MAG: hypothetical protein ACI399_01680 [Candidatus Cryptobacteroides sp.]
MQTKGKGSMPFVSCHFDQAQRPACHFDQAQRAEKSALPNEVPLLLVISTKRSAWRNPPGRTKRPYSLSFRPSEARGEIRLTERSAFIACHFDQAQRAEKSALPNEAPL